VKPWLTVETPAPVALAMSRSVNGVVELSAIIDRLSALLDAEYVPVWLNRPLAALDHRKPIDILAAGGYEELSRLIASLESPTFT
jgi:hypothetical protein